MITQIQSVHPVHAQAVAHPTSEPKPDPKAATRPVPKSGEVAQDQVTLKSAGQPDPDRK